MLTFRNNLLPGYRSNCPALSLGHSAVKSIASFSYILVTTAISISDGSIRQSSDRYQAVYPPTHLAFGISSPNAVQEGLSGEIVGKHESYTRAGTDPVIHGTELLAQTLISYVWATWKWVRVSLQGDSKCWSPPRTDTPTSSDSPNNVCVSKVVSFTAWVWPRHSLCSFRFFSFIGKLLARIKTSRGSNRA